MKIIDKWTDSAKVSFCTVELEPGFFVDVKILHELGSLYIMDNHDGSTVYGEKGTDDTIPDYKYDPEAVIALVKQKVFGGCFGDC